MYGPFSSWYNVKTDFGAVGDGVTDDTAAIQTALNALGGGVTGYGGEKGVLYFPAGTYLTTSMLIIDDGIVDVISADGGKDTTTMETRDDLALIGENPKTTIIKWGGDDGGTILGTNLIMYSRIQRLTFDGSGKAGTAIRLRLGDGYGIYPATGSGRNEHMNELSDLIIKDVGYGIQAGEYLTTGSDTISILRCKFLRNSIAGYQSNSQNTLAITISDSYFEDNHVGITNTGPVTWNPASWYPATGGYYSQDSSSSGAGNVNVYSNVFRNQGVADILLATLNSGIRHNTSIDSNAFLIHLYQSSIIGSLINLQDNLILDPVTVPIQLETNGPILLLDNTVRSSAKNSGPAVYSTFPLDIVSVGNTFTVENPYSLTFTDTDQDNNPDTTFVVRHIEIGTEIVNRNTIATTIPTVARAPTWHTGPVIEVAAPSDSTASASRVIQRAINEAAAQQELGPVIHLSRDLYNIDKTLVIPANSDIRLVGDGFYSEGSRGTLLHWTGTDGGPVIKLLGPSRATIQDLMVNGMVSSQLDGMDSDSQLADGIVIENADQADGRIYGYFVNALYNSSTGFFVDGLDSTLVELFRKYSAGQEGRAAVKVVGGPNAVNGNKGTGRVNLFVAESYQDATPVLDVSRGAKVLWQDVHREDITQTYPFMQLTDSGTVTIDTGKVQRELGDAPGIEIADFSGRVSLIGLQVMENPVIQVTGTTPTKVLALGILSHFPQASSDAYADTPYFINSSTKARALFLNSRRYGYDYMNNSSATLAQGSWAMPNQGNVDSAFILEMLKHVRSERPLGDRTIIPDGATDVRLIRVWANYCVNGFYFKRGP